MVRTTRSIFFVSTTIGGDPNTMSYPVRRPLSGRVHGVLYFSYKFTDVKTDTIAPASAAKSKEDQYVKNSWYCEVAMAKSMVSVTAYPQSEGVPYGTLQPMGMRLQHHTCILLHRQCTCTHHHRWLNQQGTREGWEWG